MPRKPIGDVAMTGAERLRRWRERKRQEQGERKEAGAKYLRAAKQAWVDDHPDHTAADFDHWGSRAATPTQERHWHDWEAAFSAKYWKGEPAAKAKPASQELVEARAEIARLRQRISELEAARGAKLKPAAKAAPSSSQEADRLRDRISQWEKFRPVYETWLEEADRIFKSRKGVMSKAIFNRIRFALHPDTYQTIDRDDRNRLSQKWEELKLALCNETAMPTQKPKIPKLDWTEMMRRREESKKAKRRKSVR